VYGTYEQSKDFRLGFTGTVKAYILNKPTQNG
jgi:hypothetical protein